MGTYCAPEVSIRGAGQKDGSSGDENENLRSDDLRAQNFVADYVHTRSQSLRSVQSAVGSWGSGISHYQEGVMNLGLGTSAGIGE